MPADPAKKAAKRTAIAPVKSVAKAATKKAAKRTAIAPAKRVAKAATKKAAKKIVRKATSTPTFGSGRRQSHNAKPFYARWPSPILSTSTAVQPCPPQVQDRIFYGNSTRMKRIPDNSIALVVTSPPYFVGKLYEIVGQGQKVPKSFKQYLRMLEAVFLECFRVLEPGGRIAVNVANLGRKPYRSLSSDVIGILEQHGFLLRGEIIWVKAKGASGSVAWGSYMRAGNPVLRDVTERVIVASKGRFDRAPDLAGRKASGLPHVSTITREAFMEATLDTWHIAPANATKLKHAAPFPVELPRRLIEMHTYIGDTVLDPFMGSGTTAVAAVETGRHYVGYDLNRVYVAAARARVAQADLNGHKGTPVVPAKKATKAVAKMPAKKATKTAITTATKTPAKRARKTAIATAR